MTKCRCFKKLVLDKYDADGFLEDEDALIVNEGEEFFIDDSGDRVVGDKTTIRLENNYIWIEISIDMFFNHFNFVGGDCNDG